MSKSNFNQSDFKNNGLDDSGADGFSAISDRNAGKEVSQGHPGEQNQPLVSIVMPNYNGDRFIATSIESVIGQTYNNWELLIVDDGSTDGSTSIVEAFVQKDSRISLIRNSENLGIYKTRNRGIARIKGQYHAVLDADDIFEPTKLKKQVAFLEANSDHALVGSATTIIDEQGNITGLRTYPSEFEDIQRSIIRYNTFANSATLVRADVIKEMGGFDETLSNAADYDLWLKITARYKTHNIKQPLLQYRVHGGQEKTNVKKTLKNTIKIQSRYLLGKPYLSPQSLAYFVLECGAMAAPAPLLLWLFKKKNYTN